ncbi:MAG: LPS translocon maturation chaperone LptM [Gammaproteobacteria bacterium]
MLPHKRLALLMLIAALVACGQKGSLVLPDEEGRSEAPIAEDLEDVSEGG